MSKLNFVPRLLIGKSAGANVGTSLPTITSGDILFLNTKQEVLDAAAIAALSDTDPVIIAMGLALGQARLSSPIRRSDVRGNSMGHFTREPYRAAAQQIDEITPGLEAGKHYRLKVLLLDELKVIAERPTLLEITDFVATGDAAADLAKLASRITKFKATYGMLKGSVADGKLRVEGLPVPKDSVLDQYQFVAFKTSFVEMDALSQSQSSGIPKPVATIQKAQGGSGLPVQLQEIEFNASQYLGNTDVRAFQRSPNASRVDPNGTYDIMHVVSFDKHQGDHEFTMESPVLTTVAVQSGSPLATFVETMLKAFLNKDAAATLVSAPDPDAPTA